MKLNSNIPHFKAYMKKSYWTKKEDDKSEWWEIVVFGLQSIAGKMLTFHVVTDSGMMRSRVPLSEIYLKPTDNDIPYYFKSLWDCFSENVSVIEYEWLAYHRCKVILRDKTEIWAKYMFTVDWYNNPYSDEPTDYKCGHILASDDGYLLCMPNNRLLWKDSNFITNDLPDNLKELKVDTELLSVENVADKWVNVENSDCYYYDIIE
jgi:hypothetical protein